MATLSYWVAECIDDAECYSIISPTKKGCVAKMEEFGVDRFEPPVRKIIEYTNAFDLFEQATGEGGGRSSTGYTAK